MRFPDRSVLGTVTIEGAGEFEVVMQRADAPSDPSAADLRAALKAWENNGAANRRSLAAFGLRAALSGDRPSPEADPPNKHILDGMFASPATAPAELDVERLMVAVFNTDSPGNWPRWDDYIAAFGSPGTPPWRRKAERIAAEYARLAPDSAQEAE